MHDCYDGDRDDDNEDDTSSEADNDEDDEITVEAFNRATCASRSPAMRTTMMSAGG